jgi:hypothetical protein
VLSLPIFPELSADQQGAVIAALRGMLIPAGAGADAADPVAAGVL